MTNEQLATLLRSHVVRLDQIHTELRNELKPTHGVEKPGILGRTYLSVPVLDDLRDYIDSLESDAEKLAVGGGTQQP